MTYDDSSSSWRHILQLRGIWRNLTSGTFTERVMAFILLSGMTLSFLSNYSVITEIARGDRIEIEEEATWAWVRTSKLQIGLRMASGPLLLRLIC